MRFLEIFQWWFPNFVSSYLSKSLQYNQQPQIHTPQTVHVHCLAKAALSFSVQTLVFLICPRRSTPNGTTQGWSPPKHGSTVDVAGKISTGVNIHKMILKYKCVAAKTIINLDQRDSCIGHSDNRQRPKLPEPSCGSEKK